MYRIPVRSFLLCAGFQYILLYSVCRIPVHPPSADIAVLVGKLKQDLPFLFFWDF